jgi:hypothetical protein
MSRLHRQLEEVNRGLADDATWLIEHFGSAEGRRMPDHVWGALQPQRSTISRLRVGARAFSALLDLHPAGDGEPLTRIGIPILPGQPGYTPAGADMVDTILRYALVGKPIPVPFSRIPPGLFDRVRVFAKTHCVAGVTSAALRVTRALLARDVTSHVTGIAALDSRPRCFRSRPLAPACGASAPPATDRPAFRSATTASGPSRSGPKPRNVLVLNPGTSASAAAQAGWVRRGPPGCSLTPPSHLETPRDHPAGPGPVSCTCAGRGADHA